MVYSCGRAWFTPGLQACKTNIQQQPCSFLYPSEHLKTYIKMQMKNIGLLSEQCRLYRGIAWWESNVFHLQFCICFGTLWYRKIRLLPDAQNSEPRRTADIMRRPYSWRAVEEQMGLCLLLVLIRTSFGTSQVVILRRPSI